MQQKHAPLRVRSAVQRHQSPERPIFRQISSLVYPKIRVNNRYFAQLYLFYFTLDVLLTVPSVL